MAQDEAQLRLLELIRLLQDFYRNEALADIMEKRGKRKILSGDIGSAILHCVIDCKRILQHRFAVA